MPTGSASIRTNALDYAPGALVVVIGTGWQAGEEVALLVNDDEGSTWQHRGVVLADGSGGFRYEFRLPSWFVATYTIWATGPDSGLARWRFTDSIGTGPTTSADNGEPGASEITIATPAAGAGRLLVAMIAVEGLANSHTICTPGGWTTSAAYRTNVSGTISVQTFYRVTTGSEAPSYTWQLRANAGRCGTTGGALTGKGAIGGITAYAGVDVSGPDGPVISLTGATGSGATDDAPAVAGVPAGSIVIRHFAIDHSSPITTAPTSSNGIPNTPVYAIVRQGTGGALGPSAAAADADQPSTGGTGTLAGSGGESATTWVAQTVVLRGTSTRIVLTLGDSTADFGSNLTPDGVPSDSADGVVGHVDGTSTSAGTCYEWAGSVSISADVSYDLKVSASATRHRLGMLTSDPAGFASCVGGQVVGPAMFGGGDPSGTWASGQTPTAGRTHPYWLGLDVRWTDPPSSTLGDTTLTFSASVDW